MSDHFPPAAALKSDRAYRAWLRSRGALGRWKTRDDAVAAINPAHKPSKWSESRHGGHYFVWCCRCEEVLALHDRSTDRIQLTDAAYEHECIAREV